MATDQRKANIVGLKWSWLSKYLTRMAIPADDTKNGYSHTIQLNKMVVEVLKKRRDDRNLLLEEYPRLGNLEYQAKRKGRSVNGFKKHFINNTRRAVFWGAITY